MSVVETSLTRVESVVRTRLRINWHGALKLQLHCGCLEDDASCGGGEECCRRMHPDIHACYNELGSVVTEEIINRESSRIRFRQERRLLSLFHVECVHAYYNLRDLLEFAERLEPFILLFFNTDFIRKIIALRRWLKRFFFINQIGISFNQVLFGC